jgi:hypothetical protein
MLRRFQISNNKSLDGVLDMLNSRWVGEWPEGAGDPDACCIGGML